METPINKIAFITSPNRIEIVDQKRNNWIIISNQKTLDQTDLTKFEWIVILAELKWSNGLINGLRVSQNLFKRNRELVNKIVMYSLLSEQYFLNQDKRLFLYAKTNSYAWIFFKDKSFIEKTSKKPIIAKEDIIKNSYESLYFLLLEQSTHEDTFVDLLQRYKNQLNRLATTDNPELINIYKENMIYFFKENLLEKIFKIHHHFSLFLKFKDFTTIDDLFFYTLRNQSKILEDSKIKMMIILNMYAMLKDDQIIEDQSSKVLYIDYHETTNSLLDNFDILYNINKT